MPTLFMLRAMFVVTLGSIQLSLYLFFFCFKIEHNSEILVMCYTYQLAIYHELKELIGQFSG